MSRGIFLCTLLLLLGSVTAQAAESEEIQQFVAGFGGAAEVQVNPATGAARFVRLAPGAEAQSAFGTARTVARPRAAEEISAEFLARHGGIFGLRDAPAELSLVSRKEDLLGGVHLTYVQQKGGVPVYAALLKTHFDRDGQLRAVNGITVPDGELNLKPSRSAADAERAAASARRRPGQGRGGHGTGKSARRLSRGFAQGRPGREPAGLARRGRERRRRPRVRIRGGAPRQGRGPVHGHGRRSPPSGLQHDRQFPRHLRSGWKETRSPRRTSRPTTSSKARASPTTCTSTPSAATRFDGAGAIMHAIFRRTQCAPTRPGTASSHRTARASRPTTWWPTSGRHAYTEFTHGLIYAWQSGALNEAYSDIYGEVVDLINGRGTDDPGGPPHGR